MSMKKKLPTGQPPGPADRRRRLLIVGVMLAPILGVSLYLGLRPPVEIDNAGGATVAKPRSESVVVSGVRRPKAEYQASRDDAALLERIRTEGRAGERVVFNVADRVATNVPRLTKETNINVRNAIEAIEQGNHPERLTATAAPAPFDLEAFEQNPSAYLDVVEPGRIWQPADPGPGVRPIMTRSSQSPTLRQNESVRLSVAVPPGAPVTFTSFDLGVFGNQLPSVTVVADDKGLAIATFTATPGTIADVNILAASPLSSGQAQFIVHVLPPANSLDVQ